MNSVREMGGEGKWGRDGGKRWRENRKNCVPKKCAALQREEEDVGRKGLSTMV